ncbi:MFS transporter [Zavarzinia sp. CC-PAN008]|uniref:MFS transporter n=1 Tax=Zavarzinia sp. CC-PAN008 TaxID=3243332 RepID=UPI003F748C3C
MIPRRVVAALSLSQFVCWGVSYYLIGVFGGPMAEGLGLTSTVVHGGFTLALVAMGVVSGPVGRQVDRLGGRVVMCAGSVLTALALAGLALADGMAGLYAAWLLLGVAMRLTLYDAAFAALVRIGGAGARRAISQVSLLGGLASTAFWPLGQVLLEGLGWRGALWVFAGLALATLPLHMMIPRVPPAHPRPPAPALDPAGTPTGAPARADMAGVAWLYVAVTTLAAFTNAGISAHTIGILAGLEIGVGSAVGYAALRGVGQSAARLAEVAGGGRVNPLSLGVLAIGLQPLSFALGFLVLLWGPAGAAFCLVYGAGHGLMTIARGTMPLVLFDPSRYGAQVGRLLAPSFFVQAMGPLAYALVIEAGGAAAALALSFVLGLLALAAALALRRRGRLNAGRS